MRYFLDTEFNGFGGELISLALAPEHGDQEYYATLPLPATLHPWVERNVVPYLGSVPGGTVPQPSRRAAAERLAEFLAPDPDPVIVADWPDDIGYFCALLTTGPGEMAPVGALRFELLSNPGFSPAATSRVPHNALHDARALRDFVLANEAP
ncbi:MAG TPA: hypothetical protein VN231_01470 [Allosphingosinicella sp.]|nr:hypothetical protein [Allosphingosinicella sp.]